MEAPTVTTTGGTKKSSVPFQRDQLLRVFEILGTPNSELTSGTRSWSNRSSQQKLGLPLLSFRNILEWLNLASMYHLLLPTFLS